LDARNCPRGADAICALFLLVDDIATERQRLQDLGISLGEDIQGDYSTLAQVRDPDATRSPWRRRHRLHTRQHDKRIDSLRLASNCRRSRQ
jgi:hypothetical protein